MSGKKFSMQEAVRFGWNTMKDNLGFLVMILILAFLIENLPGFIAGYVRDHFPFISYVLHITGWLISFVVQMGLIKISLKFCDGIKGQMDDLLSSFNLLINFVAATFLYFLIILGGLVLLVIPGVIWAIKFNLFPYFIVEKGMGPVDALKASSKATTGAKWDLLLFGLLLGLINVAGALFFVVGLFATIPTSMIAYAYVYRKLTAKEEKPAEGSYIGMGI
ncbi:MAG: hypothetical protein C4538_07925 [Nitrospiraceae bacterium]|nr:MAG: hypothetical protein C4538_07925 [Nitrospiraceae bacterium]